MREEDFGNHKHYSEQTGHATRGEHERVRRVLGQMPEGINGFMGLNVPEAQRVRRSMRRISRSGKK